MIRPSHSLLTACLLLAAASTSAQTQDPAASTAKEPAASSAPEASTPAASQPAKAPKPARAASRPGVPPAELQKLDMLKGTWTSKVTLGDGSSATGKSEYAPAFQGMYLEGDHRVAAAGKPMSGRSTWGWDPEKQQYQLVWVSSAEPAARTYYGTFPTETSLSFFTTYMMDGKAVTEKLTYTFPDANTYVFTVENDRSGTMTKVMEEAATRGAAGADAEAKSPKPEAKPATTSSGTKKSG
jgi:hypothetical protein